MSPAEVKLHISIALFDVGKYFKINYGPVTPFHSLPTINSPYKFYKQQQLLKPLRKTDKVTFFGNQMLLFLGWFTEQFSVFLP